MGKFPLKPSAELVLLHDGDVQVDGESESQSPSAKLITASEPSCNAESQRQLSVRDSFAC